MIPTSVMWGADGGALSRKGILFEERLLEIVSVFARVAILRQVHQFTCSAGQAGEARVRVLSERAKDGASEPTGYCS